jgi:hypothetical protein
MCPMYGLSPQRRHAPASGMGWCRSRLPAVSYAPPRSRIRDGVVPISASCRFLCTCWGPSSGGNAKSRTLYNGGPFQISLHHSCSGGIHYFFGRGNSSCGERSLLTSTACASTRAADANTEVRSTNVLMAEEEVSDISLATFHVFDKEGPVRLAAFSAAASYVRMRAVAVMVVAVMEVAAPTVVAVVVLMAAVVAAVTVAAVMSVLVATAAGCRGCRCAGGCGGCGGGCCLVWAGPICIQ